MAKSLELTRKRTKRSENPGIKLNEKGLHETESRDYAETLLTLGFSVQGSRPKNKGGNRGGIIVFFFSPKETVTLPGLGDDVKLSEVHEMWMMGVPIPCADMRRLAIARQTINYHIFEVHQ
jgi:hypothetical protein